MYRVLESFPRGSSLVHAGQEIDLDADEADELIADGLVEPLDPGSRRDAGGEPPTLTSAQIARLRELTPEQLDAALAPPSTPTVEAALDQALSALRQATPDEVREFFRAMSADPEIAGKVESEIGRQEQLIVAIAGLEEGNEAHWTKGGLPEVRALQAATGLADVSAAERDAAWEEYQKAKEAGAA